MRKKRLVGKLFVFEGIDSVGKSTIVQEVSNYLKSENINHSVYSFPGKLERTLGALVYDIHHNTDSFFDQQIDPVSLQMLHVAAHIDTIRKRIIPDLAAGKIVLLDRFWWSTYAYGIANGIDEIIINKIVSIEKKILADVEVQQYFLIKRQLNNNDVKTNKILEGYNKLATGIYSQYITIIDNNFEVSQAVKSITDKIFMARRKVKISGLDYYIKSSQLKPSHIFDTYWKFACERQRIFFKRYNNEKYPWTEDLILQKYKFTNAYRASDRVSQYLIKNVIYSGNNFSLEDTFFRILLFKLFNKIDTWEYMQKNVGSISYKEYDFEQYNRILINALNEKKKIYSAAYIMPSGQSSFGYEKKHQNNLKLLESMMIDQVPSKIIELKSMEQLYNLFLSYATLGKFLAFQFCIDVNYSEICDFSEMSFVAAGPGAINGINKCFENAYAFSYEYIIKYVTDIQEDEFKRLGLDFQSLWGRPLQLIDCQNLFCETDKYTRVAFPESEFNTDRKRIKQLFTAHNDFTYFYPPKWNINDKIKR